jgi:hypothetical protein
VLYSRWHGITSQQPQHYCYTNLPILFVQNTENEMYKQQLKTQGHLDASGDKKNTVIWSPVGTEKHCYLVTSGERKTLSSGHQWGQKNIVICSPVGIVHVHLVTSRD